MIGKIISHYQIVEKLGQGGMGEVYKAEDTKLKRIVALKFLPPDLTRDLDAKQRFTQEARMASALDHPSIGVIYEIDETDDGQMFIAMAYYEGETLKARIESQDHALAIDEAVDIGTRIAQGLGRAHEEGIIHRDVKPANILITNRGEVKIVDFGLAKLAGQSRLTKSGTTIGTVAYMSPEQAQGRAVDHRSDIWSLGVVLYEMLTGELPFEGEYEQAVMYSIINEEPNPVDKVRSQVPGYLVGIVDKALSKDCKERYQQLDQFLSDLGAESTGGMAARRMRGSRKRPFAYSLIALVLLLFGAVIVNFWQSSEVDADQTSIAVLPLKSLSVTADQEWFTESMTDALITDLAKVGGWRVISRTSAMRYRGSDKSMPEIAEELRVDYVIDGSVLRVGDQVKISTRLINAPKDEYLWADNYERDFRNVLALQGEIAQTIAEQVRVELTPEEKSHFAEVTPVNPEAHELYLRARYFWTRPGEDPLWKSIDYYEQALNKDPNYALAYSGMALTYGTLANHFVAPHEVMPKARKAAIKALELDKSLSEAHAALAQVYFLYDRDWSSTELEIKRAVALNPNSVDARTLYAIYLNTMGRHDEAIQEIEAAEKLDPLNLWWRGVWGINLIFARRYEEAIQVSSKSLEIEPRFAGFHAQIGMIHALQGEIADAIPHYEKADSLNYGVVFSPIVLAFVAHGYAITGLKSMAEEKLSQLIETTKKSYVCPYETAVVYVALGKHDEAFASFQEALTQNSICLIFTKIDPRLDSIRRDPRFEQLLEDVGFET